MESQAGFIVKVLVLSALVSIFIKYGASSFNLPATTTTVLWMVLLPSFILAIALSWRFYADKQRQQSRLNSQDRLI